VVSGRKQSASANDAPSCASLVVETKLVRRVESCDAAAVAVAADVIPESPLIAAALLVTAAASSLSWG